MAPKVVSGKAAKKAGKAKAVKTDKKRRHKQQHSMKG